MAKYDGKGTAKHYADQRINMAHMIEAIWGTELTMVFHEINAFKYRIRAGKKDDALLDLTKAEWSEKMAKFLKDKKDKKEGLGIQDLPLYPEFTKLLDK